MARRLLEGTPPPGAGAALDAAGALQDGRPQDWLAAALAIVQAPVARLLLERGERRGQGWAGPAGTVLVHPLADARARLVVVPGQFLPIALARLNGLGPREQANAARISVTPGQLAEALATRAAPAGIVEQAQRSALSKIAAGLNEHWRAEACWSPAEGSVGSRAVEVLDTADGYWLVIPDDPTVELWPTTATVVFRALCEILPYDHEIAV